MIASVSSLNNSRKPTYSYHHIHGTMLVRFNKLSFDLDLTHTEHRIGSQLITFYNVKEGMAYPTIKQLSKYCDMHPNAVSRGLKSLEEKGILLIVRSPGHSNVYLFPGLISDELPPTPQNHDPQHHKTALDNKQIKNKTDKEQTSSSKKKIINIEPDKNDDDLNKKSQCIEKSFKTEPTQENIRCGPLIKPPGAKNEGLKNDSVRSELIKDTKKILKISDLEKKHKIKAPKPLDCRTNDLVGKNCQNVGDTFLLNKKLRPFDYETNSRFKIIPKNIKPDPLIKPPEQKNKCQEIDCTKSKLLKKLITIQKFRVLKKRIVNMQKIPIIQDLENSLPDYFVKEYDIFIGKANEEYDPTIPNECYLIITKKGNDNELVKAKLSNYQIDIEGVDPQWDNIPNTGGQKNYIVEEVTVTDKDANDGYQSIRNHNCRYFTDRMILTWLMR